MTTLEVGPTPYASLLGPIDSVDRLIPRGVWRTTTTTTCSCVCVWCRYFFYVNIIHKPSRISEFSPPLQRNAIESSSNVGPSETTKHSTRVVKEQMNASRIVAINARLTKKGI
jgi:hypothetical protein